MEKIEIKIPENVTAQLDRLDLSVEGPNGKVSKRFQYPGLLLHSNENSIIIERSSETKKTIAMTGTFRSHILNMFHGVTAGWTYELDILYAHFPMQVSVDQNSVIIDNFLGERHPRKTKIHGETTVSIDGEKVLVTGPDIEAVGQTAGSIEQLTTIKDKDPRVFQDGIYITKKRVRGEA